MKNKTETQNMERRRGDAAEKRNASSWIKDELLAPSFKVSCKVTLMANNYTLHGLIIVCRPFFLDTEFRHKGKYKLKM